MSDVAGHGETLRRAPHCSVPGAADLQNRAVRTVEMLPADAIGMLNVTYEIDTSGEHSPARDIEIGDPERDHRAGSEEGMKFVGRTIELQNRAVGEAEPD